MVANLEELPPLPKTLPPRDMALLQDAWQEQWQRSSPMARTPAGGFPDNALLQRAAHRLGDGFFERIHDRIYTLSQDGTVPNVVEKGLLTERNLIHFLHESVAQLQQPNYGLADHEVQDLTWGAGSHDLPPLDRAQAEAVVGAAYEAAKSAYDTHISRMASRPLVPMPSLNTRCSPLDLRLLGVVAQQAIALGRQLEDPNIPQTSDVTQCIAAAKQLEGFYQKGFHQLSIDHPRHETARREAASAVIAVLGNMRPALADLSDKRVFAGDVMEEPTAAAKGLKRTIDTALAAEANLTGERNVGTEAYRVTNPWGGIGPRGKRPDPIEQPHHPSTTNWLR